MRFLSFCITTILISGILICNKSYGQVLLQYAADTSGGLFSLAANTSGTNLARVNGVTEPATPCTAGGYSCSNFSANVTFDTTESAIEVTVSPNSGYYLAVYGFSCQLRISINGPDSVKYAYSVDGGHTWPYQLVDFSPNMGACGALMTTGSWVDSFAVGYPNTLRFRIYGFDATAAAGQLQIENLYINGNVLASDGCTIPTGLYSSGITDSTATANWSPVAGATGYEIQYRPIGSSVWITQGATVPTGNLTGLMCNTTYEYQISTNCSGGGTSPFSGSSLFRTPICYCPVPTGLADSAITATSAKLYWTPAVNSVAYRLRYWQVGSTMIDSTILLTPSQSFAGLPCGTDYQFQVQNICSDTSAYTDSFSFATLSCACPTPTGLDTAAVTATTTKVTWLPVTGDLYYTLKYKPVGGSVWTTDTTTLTSRVISGLTCGTPYEFEVSSYCTIPSSSSFSLPDTFNTAACLCPTPSVIGATSTSTTSATLKWHNIVWSSYYNFSYKKVGTTTWYLDTAQDTEKVITGLECGTSYEFQVQAYCPGLEGLGSVSAPVTFSTNRCLPVSRSSGAINVYFNYPVDTTVAIGTKAKYVDHAFADTIIGYINRAKYSIDVCQSNYVQNADFSNIAAAIDSAYTQRGVTVRWIYDGNQPNTGKSYITTGIQSLASPTTAGYGAMHNKFMIIDAVSGNTNDPIVCTGSASWTDTSLNYSFNNLIFLQDSALAAAYKAEFDMMWGSTGATTNSTTAKFGTAKTSLGLDTFVVGGNLVELYFSPTDGTDAHVLSSIASATTDLYFGMYGFTNNGDALAIDAARMAGAYTTGMIDQISESGTAYATLSTTLSNPLVIYAGAYQYGNEYLIVDPSNYCSDPQLLTGSCDWTTAANTLNDENMIIVHSGTVANEYYQSFKFNYTEWGGHLATFANCSLAHVSGPVMPLMDESFMVYPNPTTQTTAISYNLTGAWKVSVSVMDLFGRNIISVLKDAEQTEGSYAYSINIPNPGVYIVKLTAGDMVYTRKVVKY